MFCSSFFFFLSHSEFVPGSTLSNFFSTWKVTSLSPLLKKTNCYLVALLCYLVVRLIKFVWVLPVMIVSSRVSRKWKVVRNQIVKKRILKALLNRRHLTCSAKPLRLLILALTEASLSLDGRRKTASLPWYFYSYANTSSTLSLELKTMHGYQ